MRTNEYDVVIIGAGSGGYVAAVRVALLGGKVCVIEKDEVGGVCLNKGCIPTKAVRSAVEVLSNIKSADTFGIEVKGYNVDFSKIVARKDEVVLRLRRGIESLFKAKRIDLIKGKGKIKSKHRIEVTESGGDALETIETKNIIIATGSAPLSLPSLKFDGEGILSSDDMLEIKVVPDSILIVGGGVIGCEFATIFSGLGSKVAIVEMMKQILPNEDSEIAKRLEVILNRRGVRTLTKTKIRNVEKAGDGLVATTSTGEEIGIEKVLVCVGRSLNSQDIGLEEMHIEMEKDRILVNERLQTNIPGIFAIGDVIGGHLLAHVAFYEGVVAAENALGQARSVNYQIVPSCIFTDPEIGSVGLTEEAARQAGFNVKIGKFPFRALGKAQATAQVEGLVKIVGEDGKDRIFGAHILGPHATELIAEICISMQLGSTVSGLEEMVFAHPTFSEALKEAAANFHWGSIRPSLCSGLGRS